MADAATTTSRHKDAPTRLRVAALRRPGLLRRAAALRAAAAPPRRYDAYDDAYYDDYDMPLAAPPRRCSVEGGRRSLPPPEPRQPAWKRDRDDEAPGSPFDPRWKPSRRARQAPPSPLKRRPGHRRRRPSPRTRQALRSRRTPCRGARVGEVVAARVAGRRAQDPRGAGADLGAARRGARGAGGRAAPLAAAPAAAAAVAVAAAVAIKSALRRRAC